MKLPPLLHNSLVGGVHRGAGFSTVTGERNFALPGVAGSGFFLPSLREQVFRRISESSLAFQRSCGSLGPFIAGSLHREGRRSPASGIPSLDLPASEIPPCRGAGFTVERDFRPGAPPGLQGSGIFPRQGRGKRGSSAGG